MLAVFGQVIGNEVPVALRTHDCKTISDHTSAYSIPPTHWSDVARPRPCSLLYAPMTIINNKAYTTCRKHLLERIYPRSFVVFYSLLLIGIAKNQIKSRRLKFFYLDLSGFTNRNLIMRPALQTCVRICS